MSIVSPFICCSGATGEGHTAPPPVWSQPATISVTIIGRVVDNYLYCRTWIVLVVTNQASKHHAVFSAEDHLTSFTYRKNDTRRKLATIVHTMI